MPFNPLKVSLDNIIPLTFARDHFSQIVSEVQQDKLFVLTKGGKPAVAIIDVKYLESITGGQVQRENITEEIKKAPEKVGLPPMVEHKEAPKPITPPMPPKPAGFAAPASTRDSSLGGPQPKIPPPSPTPITPTPLPKPVTPGPAPKPAGFAAPQPKPAAPPEPKPVPPPTPAFKPEPPNTPPAPKPEPPTPKPEPPANSSNQTPGASLKMPEEKEPVIPNKPLVNLPPVNPSSQLKANKDNIDIQFAPDDDEKETAQKDGQWSPEEKTAPDDETPPAQYSGEKDTAKDEAEPEDMALD